MIENWPKPPIPRRIRIWDGANWFTGKCNKCGSAIKFRITKFATSMYCPNCGWLWDEYTLINEKTGEGFTLEKS